MALKILKNKDSEGLVNMGLNTEYDKALKE